MDNFVSNYEENGELITGGYLINLQSMKGGGKSSANQYAIPPGLYYNDIPKINYSKEVFEEYSHETIDDDTYDKLYNLATFDTNSKQLQSTNKKTKISKKNKKQKLSKKTRKNK